jgi:putative ABC transport system permease protein
MPASTRKVRRDLRRRPLRAVLTLCGVVIGVAGVVAIMTTARNMAIAQANTYDNLSQADVRLSTSGVSDSLRDRLLAVPGIQDIELRATYLTKWRVGAAWRDFLIIGFPDYGDVRIDKFELRRGGLPQPGRIALDQSAADLNDVPLGGSVTVRTGDGERRLAVGGIVWSPVYPSARVANVSVAYADIDDVRALGGQVGYNEILAKLDDFSQKELVLARAGQIVLDQKLPVNGLTLRDPDNYPGKRELDTALALMLLFSAVGVAVSGFLVANTLSAIVAEQVGEIGTMKAIGGTRGQILRIYLWLALGYGGLGTLAGLALGTAGGWALQTYLGALLNLNVPFAPNPLALGVGATVGLVTSLVAALWPAFHGTAITVREALDHHGIHPTYGRSWLDRLLVQVGGFPPLAALSLRNLARRKARSGMTLAVIATSAAAFLAAWSTDGSVRLSISHVYASFDADAFVWFDQPVSPSFVEKLRAWPGVTGAEVWGFTNAEVGGVRTSLRGIPADTRLYHPAVAAGRWYTPGDRDAIVLSTELAEKARVGVGDSVEVNALLNRGRFRVVGLVTENANRPGSTSAGNAFLPSEVLSALLKQPDQAGFFAVQLLDNAPAGVQGTLQAWETAFRDQSPRTFASYEDVENSRNLTRILTALLYGMVIIVAAVGVLGVLNAITLNVLERRREIGVMRSLGATDSRLIQAFLGEGLLLGLLGSFVGLALGYPLARLFVFVIGRLLFPMDFYFAPPGVLLAIALATVLSGAASLIPAWSAAQLPASQALRYE